MNTANPNKKSFHWLSLFQFLISSIGILLNLSGAGICFLLGIVFLVTRQENQNILQYFQLGWVALAVILILLPSAILSITRLARKPVTLPRLKNSLVISSIALLLVPVFIWLGGIIAANPDITWLLLPPIQLYVVLVPLWWLVEIGKNRLKSMQAQENWGILGFSLVLTPFVVLVIEIVIIAVFTVILLIWLSSMPGWAEQFNRFVQRISASQMDPETIRRIVRPITSQPWVMIVAGVIMGGMMPLLEELMKPLAMWGIAIRRPTLEQGLVMGLLCGAAFAFWESSNNLAMTDTSSWVSLVIGRTGTGILHTVNSGLVGLGFAAAWTKQRYLWMIGLYLFSSLAHGIWNTLVILDANSDMVGFSSTVLAQRFPMVSSLIPVALVVLILILLGVLILVNFFLQRNGRDTLIKNDDVADAASS